LPFMELGGAYLLMSRLDLLMLGRLRGAAEAGRYAVAPRIAEPVPFLLAPASTIIAPTRSRLPQEGRVSELQALLTSTVRFVFLATLPLVVGLLVFAAPLIRVAFGEDYLASAPSLRILAFAQSLIVLGGPAGLLLDMTGNE